MFIPTESIFHAVTSVLHFSLINHITVKFNGALKREIPDMQL